MNSPAQKSQIARINRKLAKRYEKVCTSRSWRMRLNVGEHYLLDTYTNAVILTQVDLDDLENELQEAA